MKVYLELPKQSRGIQRAYDALIKYKPDSVEVVKNEEEADLSVIHVIGRRDQVRARAEELRKKGKEYAIIQYVLRSSQKPSTADWIDLWQGAKLVWSYYNLPSLCIEDGLFREGVLTSFPFYYAPLGVESNVFKQTKVHRRGLVLASGQHALSESVRECAIAVNELKGYMIHLGHDLRRGGRILAYQDVSDERLCDLYSAVQFVSGLRRIEGFELPAAEGLLCGARPILFDKPHYRHWYGDLAVYIPEESREKVIESLKSVFTAGADPVTEEEKQIARERFDWQKIITNFWNKII